METIDDQEHLSIKRRTKTLLLSIAEQSRVLVWSEVDGTRLLQTTGRIWDTVQVAYNTNTLRIPLNGKDFGKLRQYSLKMAGAD